MSPFTMTYKKAEDSLYPFASPEMLQHKQMELSTWKFPTTMKRIKRNRINFKATCVHHLQKDSKGQKEFAVSEDWIKRASWTEMCIAFNAF